MTTDPIVIGQFVYAPHRCQGMVLIIDEFGCSGPNVRRSNSINARKDFGGCHPTSVGKELSSNVFRDIGMSIQSHEHNGFQLQFGTFDFFFGRSMDQPNQIVHHMPHQIIQFVVGTNHVDAKQPSIFVTGIEGTDTVCQFMFGDFLTQSTGMIASQTLRAIVRS